MQVYKERGWSLAEDHINFTIGRQSFTLGQPENAVQAFKQILTIDSRQTATQQGAFLREFLYVYKVITVCSLVLNLLFLPFWVWRTGRNVWISFHTGQIRWLKVLNTCQQQRFSLLWSVAHLIYLKIMIKLYLFSRVCLAEMMSAFFSCLCPASTAQPQGSTLGMNAALQKVFLYSPLSQFWIQKKHLKLCQELLGQWYSFYNFYHIGF